MNGVIDGFAQVDEVSARDHEVLIEFDQGFVPPSTHHFSNSILFIPFHTQLVTYIISGHFLLLALASLLLAAERFALLHEDLLADFYVLLVRCQIE